MAELDLIRDMLRQGEWADALVWTAVLQLPPEARKDDFLRRKLHHLHGVQRGFLNVWREQMERPAELESFADLAAIGRWARQYHRELAEHLTSVDPGTLGSTVVVPWVKWVEQTIGRTPADTTLAETMVQAASHSTYHRGQVNTRIRELEGAPPLVDFIAWIWMDRPPASWPELGEA
jgi:uncharacterized damage-inducible protein DinB